MAECYKCGVEENESKLYDVITSEGIHKICANCQHEEDLPVVKKPTTYQLREAEAKGTIYERLSNIAGVNAKEHARKFHPDEVRKMQSQKEQEVSLRALVDKKFEEKNKENSTYKNESADLIHNFHWLIMRARRKKKLTQSQLAKEIGEPSLAIKMAEEGKMPADSLRFARKLEAVLSIKIIKDEIRKNIPAEPKDLFDGVSSRDIKIADLKDMHAANETLEVVGEMEEEEEMNKKGRSFLSKLFGKKEEKKEEVEENIVLNEEVDLQKQ